MPLEASPLISEGTIRRIWNMYGLKPIRLLQPASGYRNQVYPADIDNHGYLAFIVYKDEPGIVKLIENANDVSDYLSKLSMPVRHCIDPRIIKLSYHRGRRYVALYNFLPGETIPWEAYTQKHIKLLGKTMSDMHYLLGGYGVGSLPKVVDVSLANVERMKTYFADANVVSAVDNKLLLSVKAKELDRFLTILVGCSSLPGQQALHMDFVRGNILFNNESGDELQISGILDFEKVAFGHPVFDIARTLAFLIVDCKHKTQDQVYKYFLRSGYKKRGAAHYKSVKIKLGEERLDLLEALVNVFLMYDFYKFLRHNPYECLDENEHFVRTKEALIARGLLVAKS